MLFAIAVMLLVSCTPPVTVPIGTVNFTQPGGGKQHQTLLVFLPGLRDPAAVFANEGFVAAARTKGFEVDMIGVEAHVGYYMEKKFLQRMKEDVIDPAKRRGYRQIWLIGISLGGFGALWYDVENPGDLAGIVALAPYLGEPEVIGEVGRAGGFAAWNPPADRVLDDQYKIWRGLKNYERQEKNRQRVYLGYGLDDKFAKADGLLATVLPSDQVFTVAGDHDWPTWRILWERILPKLPVGNEAKPRRSTNRGS